MYQTNYSYICLVCIVMTTNTHSFSQENINNQEIIKLREKMKSLDVQITFYGLVKDNHGNSVPDAEIEVHVRAYDPDKPNDWFVGIKTIKTKTNSDGRFIISGIIGSHLYVNSISKEGYEYIRKPSGENIFTYAGSAISYKPNKDAPELFAVRKRNPPVLVIPNEAAKNIEYGHKYSYDAISGVIWNSDKQKPTGYKDIVQDIGITVNKSDQDGSYDIQIISINGGLVYDIPGDGNMAPDVEYKSKYVVNVTSQEVSPIVIISKSRENPIYSKYIIDLQPSTHNAMLLIKSFVNPSGDRNLEYDENKYMEYLLKIQSERENK